MMKKQIIFGLLFLGAIVFCCILTNDNSDHTEYTNNHKKSCFYDSNDNGICDNYEHHTCKKADYNEKYFQKTINKCDGSGYHSK